MGSIKWTCVLLICLVSSMSVADEQTNISNAINDEIINTDTQMSLESEKFGSQSIGHNLSTNNHTLNKNQLSVGTLYLGYGVTDHFSIGTSIFVLSSYEMYNVIARYAWNTSTREKLGVDFAYFKTFGGKEHQYILCANNDCSTMTTRPYYTGFLMEAAALKLTYTRQISDDYRFNATLSYFYYFDDRRPFSFRMDPAKSDPFALNLTSLNEFKIKKNFYINLEGGFWGLNYRYLYYHAGISLNFQNSGGIIGIGASTTFSPTFPKDKAKTFVGYDSRIAVHPEIQLQLFF